MASWQYSDSLISSAVSCDECHGSPVLSDNQPAEVTLYTRHGTKFCKHYTKVCPNRWCRKKVHVRVQNQKWGKGLWHSQSQDCFPDNFPETGFSIKYLYEATLQGLSDIYNQFHNFERQNISRNDLCDKRLASGFFLVQFFRVDIKIPDSSKVKIRKNQT